MKKYIRIREDNMGRTIEAWALIPEPKPLLPVESTKKDSKDMSTLILTMSMMGWGILGIYIGKLIF